MKQGVALLVIAAALTGCASTEVTSFTDPEYHGKKYAKFMVMTPGVNLEYSSMLQSRMCEAIIKKGAVCRRGLDLFPPTRAYDDAVIAKVMHERGIDGYLVVSYGGNHVQRHDMGYVAQGSASVFGNTISAYGSAVPISSYSRTDGYSAALIDVSSEQAAWVGGANTHAQGLVNVTNKVFTASLASELADELARAGHI